jgi:hypothetical protein
VLYSDRFGGASLLITVTPESILPTVRLVHAICEMLWSACYGTSITSRLGYRVYLLTTHTAAAQQGVCYLLLVALCELICRTLTALRTAVSRSGVSKGGELA